MHMITERVWCCVCNGSGKVSRLMFWKRDCPVCDGEGKRPIMMDARFPDDIKRQIRNDAMFSANTRAAPSGRGNNPVTQALAQMGII